MAQLTGRVRAALRDPDAGFGLPEVLAAMLIFALVSLGLLHTLVSVMQVGRDARARQVATNLAAEAVDRAREETNLFDLLDSTATVDLNGDTFTVSTTSQWVSDPSVDLACGAGGGILRYKRINVEVTWENMRPSTNPVRSDTVINPDTRINDATKGTILVSVLNGEGTGSAGVTVSATATSGGAPVTPVTTDAQGCAYLLQVEPGTYNVTVSRAGYVDVNHQSPGTQSVTVTRGAATSASFQYDRASAYTARLAAGTPAEVSGDMAVSWVSTYGTSVLTGPTGQNRTWSLHPFASGYTAFGGQCTAADPASWPAASVSGTSYIGERPAAVAAEPGDPVSIDVPMGLIQVNVTGTNAYLRLESVGDPNGEHLGCASTVNLRFGGTTGVRTLAVPYGSWKLYRGSSTSQTTPVTTGITLVTQGRQDADVITLDPRTVVAP